MNRSVLPASRRGFSLLEILLAVLVMALGMLSLAAVFPVVIAQQRDAVDVTTGTLAGSSATDFVSRSDLFGLGLVARDLNFGTVHPSPANLPASPDFRCPDELVATGVWEADWRWDATGLQLGDINNDWEYGTQDLSVLGDGEIRLSIQPARNVTQNVANRRVTDGLSPTYVDAVYESSDPCGVLSRREWIELGWIANQLWDQNLEPRPGEYFPDDAGAGADQWQYIVPTTSRLSPQPYSGVTNDPDRPRLNQPEFIWDFALRRVEGTTVEAAFFVRRIDPRIPIPDGETLSDVLTGNSSGAQVYPISFNVNQARPSRDGRRNANHVYSHIGAMHAVHTGEADAGGDPPDRSRLTLVPSQPGATEAPIWPGGVDFEQMVLLVARPGQKIVDNTGVVRTVVEVLESLTDGNQGEVVVRVTPPFQPSADLARVQGADLNNLTDDQRGTVVQQVLFTPDTPVDVFVERLP